MFYILRPSGFIGSYMKERFISYRVMLHIPEDNKICQLFIINSSIKKNSILGHLKTFLASFKSHIAGYK